MARRKSKLGAEEVIEEVMVDEPVEEETTPEIEESSHDLTVEDTVDTNYYLVTDPPVGVSPEELRELLTPPATTVGHPFSYYLKLPKNRNREIMLEAALKNLKAFVREEEDSAENLYGMISDLIEQLASELRVP